MATFMYNNKMLTVETDEDNVHGLHRMNACTLYSAPVLYARCAHPVGNENQKLFYLLFTKEEGWVQVSVDLAEEILNSLPKPMDID